MDRWDETDYTTTTTTTTTITITTIEPLNGGKFWTDEKKPTILYI